MEDHSDQHKYSSDYIENSNKKTNIRTNIDHKCEGLPLQVILKNTYVNEKVRLIQSPSKNTKSNPVHTINIKISP
jgi:hypothetical protein